MEKHIFNEQTGISYTLQGDYYLPNLVFPDKEEQPIGLWGQRHLMYLKYHRKVLYYNLLTSGKLNDHLADIDKQADEMFDLLVKETAEREGMTEQLKADNPMQWIGKMNNIRNSVTETIYSEIIYA